MEFTKKFRVYGAPTGPFLFLKIRLPAERSLELF